MLSHVFLSRIVDSYCLTHLFSFQQLSPGYNFVFHTNALRIVNRFVLFKVVKTLKLATVPVLKLSWDSEYITIIFYQIVKPVCIIGRLLFKATEKYSL